MKLKVWKINPTGRVVGISTSNTKKWTLDLATGLWSLQGEVRVQLDEAEMLAVVKGRTVISVDNLPKCIRCKTGSSICAIEHHN